MFLLGHMDNLQRHMVLKLQWVTICNQYSPQLQNSMQLQGSLRLSHCKFQHHIRLRDNMLSQFNPLQQDNTRHLDNTPPQYNLCRTRLLDNMLPRDSMYIRG
jgi:hypothetical protein